METDKKGQPSRSDVEHLKASWNGDPCWDLETTAGYEEFAAELLSYREMMQDQWCREREERLQLKANQLGIPGNVILAGYVLNLEDRLERIEQKVFA